MLSLFFLFSKFTFRLVSMFEICHKSIKVKKNFFYFFNIHVFCHEITQHKSKHFFLSKTRRSIARIFCLLPIANGIKFHHDKKFFSEKSWVIIPSNFPRKNVSHAIVCWIHQHFFKPRIRSHMCSYSKHLNQINKDLYVNAKFTRRAGEQIFSK